MVHILIHRSFRHDDLLILFRSRSSSSSSSASSRSRSPQSDESDTERMSSKKKVKYVETQDDLELIRLSRHKMEKFVHLPIFKKLALGCFVRIGIGQVGNSIALRQISPGEFFWDFPPI